ncbi:unnamed protein product [Ambrosiozyma monospora]|uniref:Unnamed protein product n=1 Tax=Ambrosiozyma monospora TaxID=43982 RepID=A0ACB5T864_AMBMO|nr:unnamed protein product [Ambrosiozyma monospora]
MMIIQLVHAYVFRKKLSFNIPRCFHTIRFKVLYCLQHPTPMEVPLYSQLGFHILVVKLDFDFELLKKYPTVRTLEINITIDKPDDLHSARCAAMKAAEWVKIGEREETPRQANLLIDEFKCVSNVLNSGGGLNAGDILSHDDPFYI